MVSFCLPKDLCYTSRKMVLSFVEENGIVQGVYLTDELYYTESVVMFLMNVRLNFIEFYTPKYFLTFTRF